MTALWIILAVSIVGLLVAYALGLSNGKKSAEVVGVISFASMVVAIILLLIFTCLNHNERYNAINASCVDSGYAGGDRINVSRVGIARGGVERILCYDNNGIYQSEWTFKERK